MGRKCDRAKISRQIYRSLAKLGRKTCYRLYCTTRSRKTESRRPSRSLEIEHAHARAYTRAVSSFDTLIVHRWRERCSTCSSKPSLRGSSVVPGPPSPLLVVSQEMVRVWLIFSSVSEPPGLERDELETEKGGREDPVN